MKLKKREMKMQKKARAMLNSIFLFCLITTTSKIQRNRQVRMRQMEKLVKKAKSIMLLN